MSGIGYIYKITNNQDGKIYVGKSKSTVQGRWKGHLRDYQRYIQQDRNSSKLYNAIRKYGIENFTVEQIDEEDRVHIHPDEEQLYTMAGYRRGMGTKSKN